MFLRGWAKQAIGSISNNRLQYQVFACLSLGALGLVGVLFLGDPLLFQRFLGRINPLLAFLCVIVLGFALLTFSLSQEWFAIYKKANLQRLMLFSSLAALLGAIMVLVDTRVLFAADMNISFPESLLFYPAIGFLAEILFHVLPLVTLLAVLKSVLKKVGFETIVWICISIVSVLEPIYQTMDMVSSDRFPLWAVIYVGFHILLINFFQLLIFKTHDFVSMYAFRLVYYVFWHIGWGYVRLRLLF